MARALRKYEFLKLEKTDVRDLNCKVLVTIKSYKTNTYTENINICRKLGKEGIKCNKAVSTLLSDQSILHITYFSFSAKR